MMQFETCNELCLRVTCDGQGTIFSKAGSWIGGQGSYNFEKVLLGPQGNPLQALFGQIGRRLTGENIPLMKTISHGQTVTYYAHQQRHVTVINLPVGQSIKVESEDLLAFNDACRYGLKPIGIGVISQKGLFTSELTGQYQGAQVAILTSGNPIVLETPCMCDPDAMVAFTGPDPQFKTDLSFKNLIGQASGESYMLNYTQPNGLVIIQPEERISGLDIGIDNHY